MKTKTLIERAGELASELRRGKHVGAVEALPALLEDVMQHHAADQNALPGLIAALLGCQERRDWTAMADYLGYELPTILGSVPLQQAA